ncbi:MAG: glycosyltransferase [Solirubrobacteraceae bacterium]|nr:glycosyltransferase [Solirubrobacteraceae bacterium]
MHVLLFNLATDADDTTLGFTHRWIAELAARVDRVTVVTMRAGRVELPANVTVHSLGAEHGWSEARRALRFWRLTTGITVRDRPDVVFAHMQPLFAVMYAPLAKLFRVPVLLWYAHGSVTRTLRAANAVVDRAISSSPAGYRLPGPKLHIVGQGVDTARISPVVDPPEGWRHTAVAIGRLSPVKFIDVALEAVALAATVAPELKLALVGEPGLSDAEYVAGLHRRAEQPDLAGRVDFAGPVPFDQIGRAHRAGGIVLNLGTGNALDKSLLEAMLGGCIPVSTNEVFGRIAAEEGWDGLAATHDAQAIADALVHAVSLSGERRASITAGTRVVIEADHSLGRLMDLVVGHLRALTS